MLRLVQELTVWRVVVNIANLILFVRFNGRALEGVGIA